MTRHFGATPLRRRGSAAAGAVPGRHLRAPSGQRSTAGGRRVKAHAPGRGMAPFCRHRTIPGCPDAYRRFSARYNPRLMRGGPPRRTEACARPPPPSLKPSLKPSAAHGQTDRPSREAATDGIGDQPRPQWAFGSDESTHQLSSIAQVHAMAAGCFHRLSAQPHRDAPPRAQSLTRP